jgi:RNAse (barnase) inhibitor barstar
VSDDLKTDVAILKKDVSNIQGLLSRLDMAIDKIADASNGISKILAVHDNQIEDATETLAENRRLAEREIEIIHKRISDKDEESKKRHEEIIEFLQRQDEAMADHHQKLEDRISKLEGWRWYLIGGATVIGFILAKMDTIATIVS